MMLLNSPQIDDLADGTLEVLIENAGIARYEPITTTQPQGVAERVNFVFPLPYPWVGLCFVLRPRRAIGFFIEGIGVRVDVDVTNLTLDGPSDYPLQVDVVCREFDIGR